MGLQYILPHPVLWREMEERGVCKALTLENLTTHQNSNHKRKETQEPKPRKTCGLGEGEEERSKIAIYFLALSLFLFNFPVLHRRKRDAAIWVIA